MSTRFLFWSLLYRFIQIQIGNLVNDELSDLFGPLKIDIRNQTVPDLPGSRSMKHWRTSFTESGKRLYDSNIYTHKGMLVKYEKKAVHE